MQSCAPWMDETLGLVQPRVWLAVEQLCKEDPGEPEARDEHVLEIMMSRIVWGCIVRRQESCLLHLLSIYHCYDAVSIFGPFEQQDKTLMNWSKLSGGLSRRLGSRASVQVSCDKRLSLVQLGEGIASERLNSSFLVARVSLARRQSQHTTAGGWEGRHKPKQRRSLWKWETTMMAAKQWNRLPKEAVQSQALETELDQAWSSLDWPQDLLL